MNVKPKRRWVLAVGAAVLLLMLLVGGSLMQEPKDAPRLTVLGSSYRNGRPVVSLQFEAPRRRAMHVMGIGVQEAEREHDGQSVIWFPIDHSFLSQEDSSIRMRMHLAQPALTVKGGTSVQCDVDGTLVPDTVSAPVMWQLAVRVGVEDRGIPAWKKRIGLCWQGKTLSFLSPRLPRWAFADTVVLYTEPLTNAVPRTADAPTR